MRILIVEDEPTLGQQLKSTWSAADTFRLLCTGGCPGALTAASSAARALRLSASNWHHRPEGSSLSASCCGGHCIGPVHAPLWRATCHVTLLSSNAAVRVRLRAEEHERRALGML